MLARHKHPSAAMRRLHVLLCLAACVLDGATGAAPAGHEAVNTTLALEPLDGGLAYAVQLKIGYHGAEKFTWSATISYGDDSDPDEVSGDVGHGNGATRPCRNELA